MYPAAPFSSAASRSERFSDPETTTSSAFGRLAWMSPKAEKAGPAGHAEVEQDQVEGPRPVAQGKHLVIGAGLEERHVGIELRQQAAQTVSEQQVIVGDQHVQSRAFPDVAAMGRRGGAIGPDVHISMVIPAL